MRQAYRRVGSTAESLTANQILTYRNNLYITYLQDVGMADETTTDSAKYSHKIPQMWYIRSLIIQERTDKDWGLGRG